MQTPPSQDGRAPRLSLFFTGPRAVETRQRESEPPGPGCARVRTLVSAVSPGTEMLVYRGELPRGMDVDASLSALSGRFGEAIQYGYSLVGRVVEVGEGVSADWRSRRVFAFHPHESEFVCPVDELLPVPAGIPEERAAMLANMETAVSLVHDGRPLLGERVAVLGQGVVGLLTTALLARMGPGDLVAVDPEPRRRELALKLGATRAVAPEDAGLRDFDLVYELSGNPRALDQGIAMAGFSGRVVIGSWYGTKACALSLGGAFHRSRIRLISSQVSSIAPELSGRWTKERRLALAFRMLGELTGADRLISHRFPLGQASEAYALIDKGAGDALQVLFVYD